MNEQNVTRFTEGQNHDAQIGSAAALRSAPRSALLTENDPPVFTVVNGEGKTPLVLICDHASRAVPEKLNRLQLDDSTFDKHVAYDIGASAVTDILAERLDAVAVKAGYSRLLIDVNRQPADSASIPAVSDNIVVPGNHGLSEADLEQREDLFFWPYHRAVSRALTHLWRKNGTPPALFSVHSFTPHFNGEDRPWDAGVLWNRDPRVAVPMINYLREHEHLSIGDNEPYSGREIAYSIDLHAGAAGLPNAAIEIRQDLLADQEGITYWADVLSEILEKILSMEGLHQLEHF